MACSSLSGTALARKSPKSLVTSIRVLVTQSPCAPHASVEPPSPDRCSVRSAACRGAESLVILSKLLAPILAASLLLIAASARADAPPKSDIEDVFGKLGTSTTVEEAGARKPGEGGVTGQVFDRDTGAPLPGVTVILISPDPGDGSPPPQEVRVTDGAGAFEFASVAPGEYTVSFVKAGYRASTMTGFEVLADQSNQASFPLPSLGTGTAGGVLDLDEFVVEASTVDEMMASLELRMDSDKLLNVMTAEDFSKFAADDVASALKRVAGVNVVEGKFAIIRGLEDRYSSTLYNGAPIPSPDPDRQSVQLDLFPAEIVGNLQIAKSFAGELPGNSSGGSIDIVTHIYPDEFEIKLKLGTGLNQNAWDRFLQYESNSPVGKEEDGSDTLESEFGGSIGGRYDFLGRELRYKGVYNQEIDYGTEEGDFEKRQPRKAIKPKFPVGAPPTRSGDLSLGELNLSGGEFDLTQSERNDQETSFGSFGFDLDEAGNHKIDSSIFHTHVKDEAVELYENGYLPGFDYGALAQKQLDDQEIDANADFDCCATLTSWIARSVRADPDDDQSRGPMWSSSFLESRSFEVHRELTVYQVNGDHQVEAVDGLHLSWAANHAHTREEESAIGARFFYEAFDTSVIPEKFPVEVGDLGAGRYYANGGIFTSDNEIDENQDFARVDGEYEVRLSESVALTFTTGGWWEHAKRDVDSSFLQSPSVGGTSQLAIPGDTPQELGDAILDTLDTDSEGVLSGLRQTTSDAKRHIKAWNLGSKATFLEDYDLLGGFRVERIHIESNNDPFTGEDALDGSPDIYPTKYLFLDRLDNPARNEVIARPPASTSFNDQLLGIGVPIAENGLVDLETREQIESLLNGEIDETKFLPMLGFAVRPYRGVTLRGAFSKTVARPSFREMGYYVSVAPGTDDLVIGNPQLGLSDVTSWDLRAEYTWGEEGDLFAVSGFTKEIDNPIESIIVRNPVDFSGASNSLFRTFFNNPNTAHLWGYEAELRKNLGFLGPAFFEHFTIGGNFTWIDATVDRIEEEGVRSEGFFGLEPGDKGSFKELKDNRRLFGQPEWIANADLSFDHADWGTRITLAYFAISDVLDAAGSAAFSPGGDVISFTPDRYIDQFSTLDLIASQNWRDFTFKASVKNLTDSKRQLIYDTEQTSGDIAERSYRLGLDWSFSVEYKIRF